MSLIERLKSEFGGAVLRSHAQCGDETAVVSAGRWREVVQFLRDDPEFAMNLLVDLTAVDFPNREPRFEVVAHFCSLDLGHRLRLKACIGDSKGENAEIDSISALYAAASWAERECFDLFGIRFRGHPDLRRILLYPEFIGHPLRKDYAAQQAQPLVPYREVANTDKLPPFGPNEGMSFGRQTHRWSAGEEAERDDELLTRPPLRGFDAAGTAVPGSRGAVSRRADSKGGS